MHANWMPQFTMLYMVGRSRVHHVQKTKEIKKAPVVEEVPQAEAETKTEYIYGDTQCVSGVEPEYQ